MKKSVNVVGRLTSVVGAVAAVAAVSLSIGSTAVMADPNWPNKPVTIIVPFPAGGGTDAFARPLSTMMNKLMNKQFILDYKGGAGGTLGAGVAAKAAPDGYTFFMGAVHHAIAPSMYPKLDYDIEKSFVPVALVAAPPQVIVASPKLPVNDLKGLIDYAKKNPGKLNFSSAGNGTSHHLAGEQFKDMSKTFITHIPYRGAGPALVDLMAGQVDIMFDGMGSSSQHIRSGKIKAIAVASNKRNPAFPNLPTASEAGLPGYEVSTWYALWAPKGTPQPIIDKMTAEVTRAMNTQELKTIWLNNGSETPNLTGEAFGKFVSSEIKRWNQVVKASGAKM
jgi:tripartite-type tricarboxylate transporter receptor subunit TctC